jgi:hypothetical protein
MVPRRVLRGFFLWFREQEDGGYEAEDADDCCGAYGSGQAVPVHEGGEGEDAKEATKLAHGCGDAVAGGSDFDWEDL